MTVAASAIRPCVRSTPSPPSAKSVTECPVLPRGRVGIIDAFRDGLILGIVTPSRQRAAVRRRQDFVPDQPISYEATLDEWSTYGAADFLDTTGSVMRFPGS